MTSHGWRLPCRDFAGRVRYLAVCPDAAGVVLGWPAVGSATLDPESARALVHLLATASRTAVGDPGGCAATIPPTPRGVGSSPVAASRAAEHTSVSCSAAHRTAGAAFLDAVPAVPQLAVAPGRAPASGVTAHHPGGVA